MHTILNMNTVSLTTASILLCSLVSPFPYTTDVRMSPNCSQIPNDLDHLLKCSGRDTVREQDIHTADGEANSDKQMVRRIWSIESYTSDYNSTHGQRQKRSESSHAPTERSLCDRRREYIRNASWVRARIPNIVCSRNAIAPFTILECHQVLMHTQVRLRHCFPRNSPACMDRVTVSVGCTVTLPQIVGVSR